MRGPFRGAMFKGMDGLMTRNNHLFHLLFTGNSSRADISCADNNASKSLAETCEMSHIRDGAS